MVNTKKAEHGAKRSEGRRIMEQSTEINTGLDGVICYHLRYNLYPPITEKMIPFVRDALERGRMGDWSGKILIGKGFSVSVGELIDDLHLESLL